MTAFREAFPIVFVSDVERAIEFYASTFGFEPAFRWQDGERTTFAFLQLEPLGIAVGERPPGESGDFALWIYADDVDAAADRLRAAGAEELLPPTDQPWNERTCTFRDRDGHVVHVGQKL